MAQAITLSQVCEKHLFIKSKVFFLKSFSPEVPECLKFEFYAAAAVGDFLIETFSLDILL